jgi:DnaJ-class molecular chaperone
VGAVILFGLVAIATWTGSLYIWPSRPCMRCKGTGRNSGSSGKRFGECRRCKGSGRRRRLGAKTIHHGAVSLADKARARKGSK